MPSWKKVIISGSDAALNSLDVTNNVVASSLTGSLNIPNGSTLGIGTQTFYPQGSDGFSVNENFNVGSSTQTAYHFTSGNSARPSVVFSLARTANFTNMFGVTGSAADNKFVFGAEFANTDFEWRKSLGVTPVQLQGGTLLARLDRNGVLFVSSDITGSNAQFTGVDIISGGNLDITGGGGIDTNGGNIETNGGNVNTTGGNLNIGGGALNGTVPGSAVNVDVVTATIKNFVIDHPSPEKQGYKLRYSSLEGPESAVYYRGKSTETIIDLPDYWKDLVDEDTITVNLTSFGSPCQHYIEDIKDNQVIIGCACGTPNYHFTVYGERKDVEKLVVEYKEEKYL